MILKFEIPGIPFAKQGLKFSTFKSKEGKIFSHSYQKKEVVQHTYNMVALLNQQLPEGFKPFSKFCRIRKLLFCFPPKKTTTKREKQAINYWDLMGEKNTDGMYRIYKNTRPDIDNLEKLLWDAFKGTIFIDDSLITEKKDTAKIYSSKPRIIVELEGE